MAMGTSAANAGEKEKSDVVRNWDNKRDNIGLYNNVFGVDIMAKCSFCDSELLDNEIKNYKTMCKTCHYDIMETKIERDNEYYNNYEELDDD